MALFRLATVKDPEKINLLAMEEVDKRAKMAGSSAGAQEAAFNMRKKRSKVYYEPLKCMDSMPVISPVQDMVQLPLIAGKVPGSKANFSMDFLVGSGNDVKSYLTFASTRVPLEEGPISLLPAKQENLRAKKVLTC